MLRPSLSMFDVYGPGHLYVARAHDEACAWLPNEPPTLDLLTGGQLAIAGEMPVVCSAGFESGAALDLLAIAGLEPARTRTTFRAGEALPAIARAAADPAVRLVLQHAYPPDAWPSERCWIDPELLRYLNNKANLAELAPAAHVPERVIIDRAEFFRDGRASLPIVLKAVTDQSSGGGCAVMVCRRDVDLASARQAFAACERLVAETLLDIVRSPCLNFAVMPTGVVEYLGFADQDLTPEGKHRGNWLDLGSSLPITVSEPATEVVRRAAAMGYRGFAGVDVAITRDERILVLDLNFRVNASTAAVLLAPAMKARCGDVTMHFRGVQRGGSAEQLAQTLAPLVRSGRVVPLSLFDPQSAGYSDQPARAQLLIIGANRDEALAAEAQLAAVGVT